MPCPVPPPAGQLLNPFLRSLHPLPALNRVETAYLDEWGTVLDSDNNNTSSRVLPSSGQEIATDALTLGK